MGLTSTRTYTVRHISHDIVVERTAQRDRTPHATGPGALHFEQLSSVQRAEALLQRVAPRVFLPLEVLPPAGGAAARPAEVAAPEGTTYL